VSIWPDQAASSNDEHTQTAKEPRPRRTRRLASRRRCAARAWRGSGAFELLLDALGREIDWQAEASQAWRAEGCPVGVGSMGQATLHPRQREIRDGEIAIVTLCGELGLSPKARRATRRALPGRPQGAASAPDRAESPRRRLRAV